MLLSSRDPVNPHRNHNLSVSFCKGSLRPLGRPVILAKGEKIS